MSFEIESPAGQGFTVTLTAYEMDGTTLLENAATYTPTLTISETRDGSPLLELTGSHSDASDFEIPVTVAQVDATLTEGRRYYGELWVVPASGDPIRQATGTVRRARSIAPT